MAGTKSGLTRANASAPEVRLAAQLDTSKNIAATGRPQLRASVRSTSSIDDSEDTPRTAIARRARVTLAHAAALAEVHGIGGAA